MTPDRSLVEDLNRLPQLLKDEYYEIFGDYRFGDVLTYVDESGVAFHSAVYIADDVVFTKNGVDASRPWHFLRLKEMNEFYDRSQSARIQAYRRKRA